MQPNSSTSYVGGCPAEGSGSLVKVHSPQQRPKCNKPSIGALVLKDSDRDREKDRKCLKTDRDKKGRDTEERQRKGGRERGQDSKVHRNATDSSEDRVGV